MNMEIANRLAALRKTNGYSQEALAEKLGISRQAISKWERGESSPDTDHLIALSGLYAVSLDALLHADADPMDYDVRHEEQEEALKGECGAPAGGAARWYGFPYPLVVVTAYCLLGATTGNWGDYWLLFLTIPLYYLTVNFFDWKGTASRKKGRPPRE